MVGDLWEKKYIFVLTKKYNKSRINYLERADSVTKKKFEKQKNIFNKDIYDPRLKTHPVWEKSWVIVYSSEIKDKDRVVFFFEEPKFVFIYKIMEDHDYNKLKDNVDKLIPFFKKEIINPFKKKHNID